MDSALSSPMPTSEFNAVTPARYGGNMTVMDVLDRAFRIYRENFIPFLAITAAVTAPIALLSIPIAILQQRDPFGDTTTAAQGILGLINLLAAIVQMVVIQTMVAYMASEGFLGRRSTLGEAFRSARPRFGAVAVAFLLYIIILASVGAVSGILTLCAIGVVGFIFLFYLASAVTYFLTPVLALEDVNATQGLNRAWHLGKQRFWRGLSLLTLISLISLTFYLALGGTAELLYLPLEGAGYFDVIAALRVVVNNIITILITPIQLIAFTVFYYDTRVRLEGLDVSFYLSKHNDPRPLQIPSPKPAGGIMNGQDFINLLIIVGGTAAITLVVGGAIYVTMLSLGLA